MKISANRRQKGKSKGWNWLLPIPVWLPRKRGCLYLFVLLVLLAGCGNPQLPQGKVATLGRVVSGQTIEVLLGDRNPPIRTRVRLLGIQAPDLRQDPWGEEAKRALETLLPNKTSILLELESEEKDRYDRLWAYVWHDGKSIQEELLRQGVVMNQPVDNPRYEERLHNAREYARLLGLGIWNPENPLQETPSEFRG